MVQSNNLVSRLFHLLKPNIHQKRSQSKSKVKRKYAVSNVNILINTTHEFRLFCDKKELIFFREKFIELASAHYVLAYCNLWVRMRGAVTST